MKTLYAISAVEVARKMQRLQTEPGGFFARAAKELPCLPELMLYTQAMSWRPEQSPAFLRNLVEKYPNAVGTKEMLAAGATRDVWPLEKLLGIWRTVHLARRDHGDFLPLINWRSQALVDGTSLAELRKYHGGLLATGQDIFNAAYLTKTCAEIATRELPDFLVRLCRHEDVNSAPEHHAGLLSALQDEVEAHAAREGRRIADTKIKELVFQRLNFAEAKKFPVTVLGDARIGKTSALTTWCAMRPGRRRLVTMPESNSSWDFYAAMADALGIPCTPATPERTLKREVEFVLAHTRLFLVFDEFHYALPVSSNKRAVPHRLNWIRSHIVDKGHGCAFSATRQTMQDTFDNFVANTKYQMEQWIGRIAEPLTLPALLDEKDLLEIARVKFPDFDPDALEIIVGRCVEFEEAEAVRRGQEAKRSKNARPIYSAAGAALRQLEPVVKYTEYLAETAGRSITPEIIEEAWCQMTAQGLPELPVEAPREKPAPHPRRPREVSAEAQAPEPHNRISDRELAVTAAG